MTNVVIAGFVRSPFTPAGKGSLARVRPDEMAADVVRALIERTQINPEDIEDVIAGCAFPEAEQGLNVGRLIGLLADLPIAVAGATVNRFCGSSMYSIHMAAGAIKMGAGEAFVVVGVESMSRVPMGGYNPLPSPRLYAKNKAAYISMGETAENVAKRWRITRSAQEEFAVGSHRKAATAQRQGKLRNEIVPINTSGGICSIDECIRSDTTLEALAGLKPAFDAAGLVTAGTSSPLTDGTAAVLVCSEDYAMRHGLAASARIVSIAVAGCAPEIMGSGPVVASRKALARARLKAQNMDVIELNEAFSSQVLASIQDLDLDVTRVNLDGGAIALGHPLGASGARITGKAAQLLEREGGKYALATQCIGGGQGIATVLEAI